MIAAPGASLVRWAVPVPDAAADDRFVETFDAVIGKGERRAARHLTCRLGCTALGGGAGPGKRST